jgi:predicted RNA binding protein YcfA (HicA-like mRNA interferase family)
MLLKSYSSRDVIAKLEADGWFLIGVSGSHRHFKHKEKPGKVTVKAPCKDMPPKTLRAIQQQARLPF